MGVEKLGESRISIKVHNSGNPIAREDQTMLFEQYQRTRTAPTGGQVGWGLGLTLVRGIVNAHGGETSVTSEVETGTIFTVVLPLG